MTRRDQFIAHALSGLLANPGLVYDGCNTEIAIKIAIGTVDELLATIDGGVGQPLPPNNSVAQWQDLAAKAAIAQLRGGLANGDDDGHVALNGLDTIASRTWTNPRWAKDVFAAVKDVLDDDAPAVIRERARVLLRSLDPALERGEVDPDMTESEREALLA